MSAHPILSYGNSGPRLGYYAFMLREHLQRVLSEYQTASTSPLKNNTLAVFIRGDIPESIVHMASISDAYKVQGSPGRGNWAEIPWIGLFDREVTTSAERGYYSYKKYPHPRLDEYNRFEDQARQARRGLWGDACAPITPVQIEPAASPPAPEYQTPVEMKVKEKPKVGLWEWLKSLFR